MNIGINGLGRVGRCVLRSIFEYGYNVNYIQLNIPCNINDFVHLLKYDSVHGIFNAEIEVINDKTLKINGVVVEVFSERDLEKQKWNNVDVVMECTGKIKEFDDLSLHIRNGAKNVILSCPPKDETVLTYVIGVNHDNIGRDDKIVSIGSCTTNCLGPVVKMVHDEFGIQNGFVSTIHSYTNDQNILDGTHKDLRRGRACAVSMIPTSTGAAKTIGVLIPELKGKIDGGAIRVPTPNVSMIDCSFVLETRTDTKEVHTFLIEKSKDPFYSTVVSTTTEPLVSIDFNHNKYSSIIDILETKVIDGTLLRLVSWYDNEWAFAVRMMDCAEIICKRL